MAGYWSRHEERRLVRRRFLGTAAVGGLGAAAASIVGCGDDDAGGSAKGGSTPAPGATTAAQPKKGGTFRWEGTFPIKPFVDPHFVANSGTFLWQFVGNVAVRWDAPGSKLVPELLDSWESTDGASYVATVKPNVKTHNGPLTNGRVFDAEDLAANMMRISGLSDPQRAASYVRRSALAGLESAKAIDASKVQVKFASPTPFPYALTDYLATFLPRENFADPKTLNDPTKVAGTGPWFVSDFAADQSMTFKPHPDFWGGHAPYMDSVVLRQAGDRVSQMASFIQGQAAYFENPSKVERETIAKSANGSQLFAWPGSTCAYQLFNVAKPPLDDVRVRRALHLATNYVKNQEDYWGAGFYTLGAVLNNAFADALQPADVLKLPGWRPDKTADIKDANDLLTAAGFPAGQGLKLQILAADTPTQRAYGYDFATRQMDNWRQAFPKIDASFKLAPDDTAVTTLQRSKDFQITSYGRVSSAPESADLAQHATTKGSENLMGYSNARVDDLLQKALTTLQAAEASSLVKQAQQLVLDDLPYVILHRLHQAGIYAPSVRGFPTIPGGTTPLAGSFENWNSVSRHTAVMWFES